MSAIAKSVDIKDCEFKKIKNEVLNDWGADVMSREMMSIMMKLCGWC